MNLNIFKYTDLPIVRKKIIRYSGTPSTEKDRIPSNTGYIFTNYSLKYNITEE